MQCFVSSVWNDGLLLSVLRKAAQQPNYKEDSLSLSKSIMKWILLDGQLDDLQMDTFTSLLGSSRTLIAVNNESIYLPETVKILWEVSGSHSNSKLKG